MKVVTAGSARLGHLYHYQRFDAARLETLLATNCIYCSSPFSFNDPWDCRPWFSKGDLNDSTTRERHIRWIDRCARRHGGNLDEQEHRRRLEVLRRDSAFLERLLDQMSREMGPEMNMRYRVYCLSSKPTSTLMWSHYAQNHEGICLEFSAKDEIFCSALKVDYRENYPLLALDAEGVFENLLPLLTKSDAWMYEDEYRLVAQEEAYCNASDTLVTKGNLLKFPVGALTSIVVGCNANDTAREKVKQLVAAKGRNVALKQAVRVPDRYEVQIL